MMTQSTMNSVSIRSLSDGHSFSAEHLTALADKLGVALLASAKSVALPREYADLATAEAMLCECAMAPLPSERVAITPDVDGVAVAMALPREVADKLDGRPFMSPLLMGGAMERGISLWLSAGVAFVRVYDNGLKLAEAVEVATLADLRYLLESLDRVYNIYSTRARVTADAEPWLSRFAELSRTMRELFTDVVCEL